ncbi:MAG: hypothetical protein ACKPKO_56155, partial [Candidatus Fonsibacter sp.]
IERAHRGGGYKSHIHDPQDGEPRSNSVAITRRRLRSQHQVRRREAELGEPHGEQSHFSSSRANV